MSAALLLVLIEQIGIPELKAWLASRRATGQPTLTDADVLAKLTADTDFGIKLGEAWLTAHPVT